MAEHVKDANQTQPKENGRKVERGRKFKKGQVKGGGNQDARAVADLLMVNRSGIRLRLRRCPKTPT